MIWTILIIAVLAALFILIKKNGSSELERPDPPDPELAKQFFSESERRQIEAERREIEAAERVMREQDEQEKRDKRRRGDGGEY
ncbi:hypothetical protein [Glycomyces buryatensis]|uniref:Uncharacterized protein n=1 Tax=Glycomyces buryatensis TaxID=2570927 RepID=A0A4S8QEU5_9ACTN|nr:hypothetical protein [Glycomyces buryatensis]THV41435.1 hypothetical protein FAB82_11595 [Glycomyces buryatensis]